MSRGLVFYRTQCIVQIAISDPLSKHQKLFLKTVVYFIVRNYLNSAKKSGGAL